MYSFKTLFFFALSAIMVACATAQLLQPIAGTRDLAGGYLDHYTGQYSSAITGRVYNTAPAAVIAAPAIAHHIAAPIAAPIHAAPIAWIRR